MSDSWMVDAGSPLLDEEALARFGDDRRPDRLTWNAFRTLALWDTDVWVPRLVEVACGDGSPLVAVEWSGGSVRPWAAELVLDAAADVMVEGPEAQLVIVTTLLPDLPVEQMCAAARRARADILDPAKQAGLIIVVPPSTPEGAGRRGPDAAAEEDLDDRIRVALAPSPDLGVTSPFVETATGWVTWRELGELALDVAEEADELRREQVHRLVGELQTQFPDVEL